MTLVVTFMFQTHGEVVFENAHHFLGNGEAPSDAFEAKTAV